MRRLLLAATVALIVPARSSAQISPGPLSRAHQALEGATQCSQCHGAGRDALPRQCLACHRDIAALIAANAGWHGRPANLAGKSCGSCHPEHAGRDFALIVWPTGGKERFDHAAAGWPLEGRHAGLTCDRCHRTEFRTGPVASLSPRKSSPGWTGLDTACVACHRSDDPHGNSLGPDCRRCHDATAWSPAPRFDHASSRYPLTGRHTDVPCGKCHQAPAPGIGADAAGKRVPRFRPLAFQECSSCHADPHQGRLSAKCSSCHVTEGFDVLRQRGFDHAVTGYPLLGKHRAVPCAACHGRDMSRPRPGHDRCATCHADVHAGEATLAGVAADCSACHDVDGFTPSTFTPAAHQATRFPLNGKHANVTCRACHTTTGAPGTAAAVIRMHPRFDGCQACHESPHGNQLSGRRCDQCHTDAGWPAIRYDRADHAATRLPLSGRHGEIACSACHGPRRDGLPPLPRGAASGTAGVVFHLAEVRCADCHADPHRGSRTRTGVDSAAGCGACHGTDTFAPSTIAIEVHSRFGFALEGAHRAVPCGDCHAGFRRPASPPTASTLIRSTPAPRPVDLAATGSRCAGCHLSPHGSQFASRPDSGACDACHGTDDFHSAPRFDHDRDAAFVLAGAHASVPCARCHPTVTVGGSLQVRYRPIPHRCEDCHTGRRTGAE